MMRSATRFLTLTLLVIPTGCGPDPEEDLDGDGFTVSDGDCDDGDAARHPGAEEHCNGLDDDCDGDTDEEAVDALAWYLDADDDHFGDPASVTWSCAVVSGHRTEGGDCDDNDPAINPDADEVCNGVDDDCDGDTDESDAVDAETWYVDGDGDGWGVEDNTAVGCGPSSALAAEAGDCDDDDPDINPGAYERPDDDIDQDCDGEDRSFDGVVLDHGATLDQDLEAFMDDSSMGYDLAVVLDTTNSMRATLMMLNFGAVEADRSVTFGTVHYGFAVYQDYAWGTLGSPDNGDLPFTLRQRVTDDMAQLAYSLTHTETHHGGDRPESSLEALHQALTGAGYDQNCDGVYDASTDVPPWLAGADDPFGGAGGQTYNPKSSGEGLLGGMGFREGTVPIVAYITDAELRDPDEGYESPGGCPGDAGSEQVVADVQELGAWLVGLHVTDSSTSPAPQMADLALRTGSQADLDGDGSLDPLVFTELSSGEVNDVLVSALAAIDHEVAAVVVYDEVSLALASDPWGMVQGISPASHSAVSMADWPLVFSISWAGTLAATEELQVVTVGFDVLGDGAVIGAVEVTVEIPPS
jgi:hypothetical protein